LISGYPCDDSEITGPSGTPYPSCWGAGTCAIADPELIVWLYVFSDMTCPNQLVLNYVGVSAQVGYAGLYGNEIGTCELNGWTRGIGESFWLCTGAQNSVAYVFPDACYAEPGVDPPPQGPPPPQGGRGVVLGCNYCAYNWMTDAGCHDANDTYCPPKPLA